MTEPSVNSQSGAGSADKRLQSLAVFIELEKRLRSCVDVQSLSFSMVNETHSLCPYRQAILWQADGGINGRILAVSGLAAPDPSAPFSSWIRRLASASAATNPDASVRAIHATDVAQDIRDEWQQWLPANLLWVPVLNDTGGLRAVLMLARDHAWLNSEKALLSYLGDTLAHAWSALEKKRHRRLFRLPQKRRTWMLVWVAIVALGLIPVTQTTLAPAEIIARDAFMVRAGVDGVIDTVHAEPNQVVQAQELLINMDGTRLRNQLEVANRALEVADAEYRQAAQQGLFDTRANASLAILQGHAEQRLAEVSYLQELLQRIEIRAPHDGVVIFDSADEWEGRPVVTGERIMMLANPEATELEIRVPVADAIALQNGARVRVFLNTRPHSPLDATLSFASYQAELTPDGILAYRLVARFTDDSNGMRIGLKGTAKLYGDRTLLVMYLLRRPLTSLRQLVGF